MTASAEKTGERRRRPWRIAGWGIATFLLLLPAVAMRFSDEVNWTTSDFIFAVVMIGGTGLIFELVVRMTRNSAYRAAVGLALAAIFLLVWFTGAVGIIGNEGNPANLMFGGVILIAIVGAVVARFRPLGMVYALTAAAVAQVLVGIVALAGGMGATDPSWPWDVVVSTGFFTALWLLAAQLMQTAARQRALAVAAP